MFFYAFVYALNVYNLICRLGMFNAFTHLGLRLQKGQYQFRSTINATPGMDWLALDLIFYMREHRSIFLQLDLGTRLWGCQVHPVDGEEESQVR